MSHIKQLTLLKQQLICLERNRILIDQMMGVLEYKAGFSQSTENALLFAKADMLSLFGEKDTIANQLVKLTGLMTKIIPLELELLTKHESALSRKTPAKNATLAKRDQEIIQRFLRKRREFNATSS